MGRPSTPNREGARFCGGCGLQLDHGSVGRTVERRPLTFLFCDLVDSTSLFERLDPEDVREVQNTVRGLFRQLAVCHGAYVAEYVGDGVVMYFGYPQAQEDDPERAIRCGLAIGREIVNVRARMRCHPRLKIAVRFVGCRLKACHCSLQRSRCMDEREFFRLAVVWIDLLGNAGWWAVRQEQSSAVLKE